MTDSPRDRILATTKKLFYNNGIQATGVDEVVAEAAVSKRTLYRLFESKDQLITEYLAQFDHMGLPGEHNLDSTEITPRERLIALFDRPRASQTFRGCPMHNAAVELADPNHPARALVAEHKTALRAKIIAIAEEAGAPDPEVLGTQLHTLAEGASSLATSLDDVEPFDHARTAAMVLIDHALGGA
ncbi:TetR/AcrR family transcriptional regulator [Kibdelosporangium philippinense]|uniref:TetR/AcrR family transcriptional regulator n=1 Tax=Kibdelosporangium philippinense TaxID=211113 RepID=A0ABS8ZSW8_9PSEU|nr:TetR/AcrR family transcriptional regulator [Kibdelosporangium philippinense]MCE7010801.1 TetR/AcrR family transcriptional regulator [Kibdelosporangium philippinense]